MVPVDLVAAATTELGGEFGAGLKAEN